VVAIEAIYDAAAAPARWPVALQAIADYFGDVGALIYYQRDDGSFGTTVSPDLRAGQADYKAVATRHSSQPERGVRLSRSWWRHRAPIKGGGVIGRLVARLSRQNPDLQSRADVAPAFFL
jgi:hypothetical protein